MTNQETPPPWLRKVLWIQAAVAVFAVAASLYAGVTLVSLEQTKQKLQADIAVKQQLLDQTGKELEETKRELEKTKQELGQTKKDLQATTDLKQYEHPVTFMAAKAMFDHSGLQRQAKLLMFILDRERTRWHVGGRSEAEGFDSPRFAAYVLQHESLADVAGALSPSVASAQDAIRLALPSEHSPGIGDIVFYSTGYTMFFFTDERGKPFVIGMTPFGVLALEPDFARITGYGKVFR